MERKQKISNVHPTKQKIVTKQTRTSFSFSSTNVIEKSFPTPKVKILVVKY